MPWILGSNRNEQATDMHDDLDDLPENYAEWEKKLTPKAYMLYFPFGFWNNNIAEMENRFHGCRG